MSRHPAADEVIDLYERHAVAWDAMRPQGRMERPWLDRFLATMGPGPRVLDIGCGAGRPIAAYLIERGCVLSGLDASPSLIALCRERFPEQTWTVGDMRRMDLGRRFDGLLAWDSFFHLAQEDQRAMFAVFGAHAEEGAALMFSSGPAAGEALGEFQGEVLHHASLDAAEYRSLLAGQGFVVLDHVVEDPACGGRTVWLARRA